MHKGDVRNEQVTDTVAPCGHPLTPCFRLQVFCFVPLCQLLGRERDCNQFLVVPSKHGAVSEGRV